MYQLHIVQKGMSNESGHTFDSKKLRRVWKENPCETDIQPTLF